MAEPNQKSLELPSYITRNVAPWTNPAWLEADRWRRVVHNQPVAAICQSALIADIQSSTFEIRPKEPKEEDALADDIDYYNDILNPELPGGIAGFDMWAAQMAQDLLDLPIGGNSEIVRWPDGMGPLSLPTDKGHVAKIVYIDGATLRPIYDPEYVMMQKLQENITQVVYFRRAEIGRMLIMPRPEIQRWGYGMSPPEKVFLAINMLYRSDTYYANLLLDTPEAGILDLIDMDKQSAQEWLSSFRELMTGIDPLKIPVLYQHTKKAEYISFGRPPTEMLLAEQTIKFAQITAAGYGLMLADIGLGEPQKTLAGTIRDERRSRRSGFGVVKEKFKNFLNDNVLPDYLEFVWIDNDEETRIQKARSFLLSAQALEKAKALGAMTSQEAQAQLVNDGHITVEVMPPEEPELPLLPPPPPAQPNGNGTQDELDRVPPGDGGRGDVGVSRGPALGDPAISAVPRDSSLFDQMGVIFKRQFNSLTQRAEPPQLLKLIRKATKLMFPDVAKAFIALSESERPDWTQERIKMWVGEASAFDEFPDIKKASDDVLAALDDVLNGEQWWALDLDPDTLLLIYKMAYSQGATAAAEEIQMALYVEGLASTPNLIGLNFDLKNPRTLKQLETKAAQLVRRVNDGTKYYLKRIIVSGVDEGLSSPGIAEMIAAGSDVNEVLKQAGYTEGVIRRAQAEIAGMSENRLNSIVNTEINRAESEGRLGQWQAMGLTKKAWSHTGEDRPCPICRANQDLGFVAIDYVYRDVFDGTTGPPAHPQLCHCHLEFDEEELFGKADTLNVWMGD